MKSYYLAGRHGHRHPRRPYPRRNKAGALQVLLGGAERGADIQPAVGPQPGAALPVSQIPVHVISEKRNFLVIFNPV